MNTKVIAIGCDHAGYPYKDAIKSYLETRGFKLIDYGTDGPESVDYPDFIHPVAKAVSNGIAAVGVVLCGSGNGVSMTANKYEDIRCALCWMKEIAQLARQHNDANIIALPARYISRFQAIDLVESFLDTPFEGGRHSRRVDKIACT